LRVSGLSQVKGDGFPRQREAIQKYAAANGMRVVQFFEEKALSGKTEWEQRPEWVDMLRKIEGGSVRMVLIERLDRLARQLLVQEHIIADLQKRGITLISVKEPDLCSNDPERKLLRQIVGAIAEYDRAMIVAKLKAARDRQRAKHGRCEGPKLYGDKLGEAAVRDRIRKMRVGRATLQTICDTLNAEGVPTRHGRSWLPMTVQRIATR
jgi:DNA invertase Pin-like site-specific DNA recombinase